MREPWHFLLSPVTVTTEDTYNPIGLARRVAHQLDARYQGKEAPASAALSLTELWALFDLLGGWASHVDPGDYSLELHAARGITSTPIDAAAAASEDEEAAEPEAGAHQS